jgi:hypothetical protein
VLGGGDSYILLMFPAATFYVSTSFEGEIFKYSTSISIYVDIQVIYEYVDIGINIFDYCRINWL